jgi:hypothetical protein
MEIPEILIIISEILQMENTHKKTKLLLGDPNVSLYELVRRLSVCDAGWTTMVFASARCTNQDLISTKHRSHPKGRNDGRIASFSHRTRGGYKNLPLPPNIFDMGKCFLSHLFCVASCQIMKKKKKNKKE